MNALSIISYNHLNKAFWDNKLDTPEYIIARGDHGSDQLQFLKCSTVILDFYFSNKSEEEEKEIIEAYTLQLQQKSNPVTLFVLSPNFVGSFLINHHRKNVQMIAHNFCGTMLDLINSTSRKQSRKAS